jgi:hypothetical protein
MPGPLGKWWSDGEDGAVHVSRKGYGAFLLTLAVVGALLLIPGYRDPRLAPLYVILLLCSLVEARRAIIFTPQALLYRPSMARARRVPFREVLRVTEANVGTSVALKATIVKGVQFDMKDGTTIKVALDFPGRDEILQRLRSSISGPARAAGFSSPPAT